MIGGFQGEFLTDALELVQLRLLQRVVFAEELRGRIHHCRVEKLLEQRVAQVVVGRDVFLRAFARVAVEPVQRMNQRAGQARHSALHRIQYIQIADKHPDHRRQVWSRPVAMNEGLARTDGTVAGDHAPGCRVQNMDFSLNQRAVLAEHMALTPFDNHQLAVAQSCELPQHTSAQEVGSQTIGAQIGRKTTATAFHGVSPWIARRQHGTRRQRPDGKR